MLSLNLEACRSVVKPRVWSDRCAIRSAFSLSLLLLLPPSRQGKILGILSICMRPFDCRSRSLMFLRRAFLFWQFRGSSTFAFAIGEGIRLMFAGKYTCGNSGVVGCCCPVSEMRYRWEREFLGRNAGWCPRGYSGISLMTFLRIQNCSWLVIVNNPVAEYYMSVGQK